MTYLILGLIIFVGAHSLRIVADDWRSQMVARLGDIPWKGLNSVVSLIGVVLMVMGYGLARQSPVVLWQPPFWISHLVSLLMLIAFILLVAAYIPGNGIKAKLGHPMVISVKIWAASHLLANGTLADLVLFGVLLIWAVMSFRAARQRDRRDGVIRPKGKLLSTLITIVVGAGAWAWFVFHGHAWLIGVRPLVMAS
jgi:uncharacterized membrane protein